MSEFEPDSIVPEGGPQASAEEVAPAEQTVPAEQCAPKRPLWVRVLKGVGITVVSLVLLLVVGGLLLYNFGGPSGSAIPGVLEAYDEAVAAGQAAPIQKRFVIPIPGCQCHSKDPTLSAQHQRRHMNECGKCHNTRPAHMEPGIL